MSLIILAAIILIPQIGHTQSSDLTPEHYYIGTNVVPEIEVVATRLTHEPLDSIGPMPGIIIYGEKPSVNESLYIQKAQKRNDLIINLSEVFGRYALFGIVALFMLTLSVAAITKVNRIAHIHIKRHDQTSALHKYYLRHKNEMEREMQRYLSNLIGNSK